MKELPAGGLKRAHSESSLLLLSYNNKYANIQLVPSSSPRQLPLGARVSALEQIVQQHDKDLDQNSKVLEQISIVLENVRVNVDELSEAVKNVFHGAVQASETCAARAVEYKTRETIANEQAMGRPSLVERTAAYRNQCSQENQLAQEYCNEARRALDGIKNSVSSIEKQNELLFHKRAVEDLETEGIADQFKRLYGHYPRELSDDQEKARDLDVKALHLKEKYKKIKSDVDQLAEMSEQYPEDDKIAEKHIDATREKRSIYLEYQATLKAANELASKVIVRKDVLFNEERRKDISDKLLNLKAAYKKARSVEVVAESIYNVKSGSYVEGLEKNANREQDWSKYENVILYYSFFEDANFFNQHENDPQIQKFKLLTSPAFYINNYDLIANGVEPEVLGRSVFPVVSVDKENIVSIENINKAKCQSPVNYDHIKKIDMIQEKSGEIVDGNSIPADKFMREYLKAKYAHANPPRSADLAVQLQYLQKDRNVSFEIYSECVDKAVENKEFLKNSDKFVREAYQKKEEFYKEQRAALGARKSDANDPMYKYYDEMSSEALILHFKMEIGKHYLAIDEKLKESESVLDEFSKKSLRYIDKSNVISDQLKKLTNEYKKQYDQCTKEVDKYSLRKRYDIEYKKIQLESNRNISELRNEIVGYMNPPFQNNDEFKKNIFAAIDAYARGQDRDQLETEMKNIYKKERGKISAYRDQCFLRDQSLHKALENLENNHEKTLFTIVRPLSDPDTIKGLVDGKKQRMEKGLEESVKKQHDLEKSLGVLPSDAASLDGKVPIEQRLVQPAGNSNQQTPEKHIEQLEAESTAAFAELTKAREKREAVENELKKAQEELEELKAAAAVLATQESDLDVFSGKAPDPSPSRYELDRQRELDRLMFYGDGDGNGDGNGATSKLHEKEKKQQPQRIALRAT